MGYQIDADTPGYYRKGDTVKFWNPDKKFGDGQPWDFLVLLDGSCKRKEVAMSRKFWAINSDGGYLYSNMPAERGL